MKLFSNLKRTAQILNRSPGCWAVCGGIAACVYRTTPRFTGDIDIALIDFVGCPAKGIAEDVAREIGYSPIAQWITDNQGEVVKEQALVLGRENN